MGLIEEYLRVIQNKEFLFERCLRKSGPFTVGPTKKGGNFITYNDKNIDSNVSAKTLKGIRDTIDLYLNEVIGE